MQLRMTLAELGMSSIPSIFPVPRIAQALAEDGRPLEPWVEQRVDRFLAEFCWYARAMQRERAGGTPY
jgi:hypothetical protein